MLIAIIGTCLSLAITYHPTNDPLRVLHTAYPGAFLLQRWRTWCTCTISSGRWRDKPCNRHMPPVIWRRHLDLLLAEWFCDVWGTPPHHPSTFPLPISLLSHPPWKPLYLLIKTGTMQGGESWEDA